MALMQERPCKYCRKPIKFLQDPEGKWQALDAVAPVFRLHRDVDSNLVAVRDREAYVSHFATCPKATEASKKKAPAQQEMF